MEEEKTQQPTLPNQDEIVQIIAEQLSETEEQPLQLLKQVVKRLGTERSLAFLKEALEIEAQGGLMIGDGSRRRTPGGTFFYLVRKKGPYKSSTSLHHATNQPQKNQNVAEAGQPPSQQSTTTPFTWEDRISALHEIGDEKGMANTVKITLIGRPGKIVDRGTCVVTSMASEKVPALPKGLPTPQTSATAYTVYIAANSGRK